MNRWQNYGLWASIFALIPMICKAYGIDVIPGNYDEMVQLVLSILVAAGIISNPEKGIGYIDK